MTFSIQNILENSFSSIQEIESGNCLNESQLKVKIKERAQLLKEKYHLEESQPILIEKMNSIDFFIDFFAILQLKCVAIPLSPDISTSDENYILNETQAKLIIRNNEIIDRHTHFKINDIALILFTSGSTGAPKGVLISGMALEEKIKILQKNISKDEVENSLCFLPTHFGHGLICNSLFPIFSGKNFYIYNHLSIKEASQFATNLEKHSITFFSSVPSTWEIILNFSSKPSINNLKLLRVHCASAPMNSDKKLRIKQGLGTTPVYDVYGATEMLGWFSASLISNNPNDWIESHFTEFWDAEAKISEANTLLIKSNYMFSGYLNGEIKDEFFNTGDIFLNNSILGREKSTINKNGIKIYTQELNSIYLKSQLLHDVATFPIPHLFSGEEIGVYVVVKPGVSHDHILNYFNTHISPHKQPFAIYFVDTLPTNSRGKVAFSNLASTVQSIESAEKNLLEIFNKTLNTNFKELTITRENFPKWDSMKHAELILNLQKSFNIKFKISEIQNADSLKKIFNYLLNHLPK